MRLLRDVPMLPGAAPVVGHLREMRRDRIGFVSRLAHHVDRMARIASPLADAIVVNHPEVLQELLVEKARVFEKSHITRFSLAPLGGEGLFTSRYSLWKRQRKLMAPLFQPSQIHAYASAMVECAARGMAGWRDGEELELLRETTRITMSIAGKTLFDTDTFGEADAIGAALTTALDWVADSAPSPIAIAHLAVRKALVNGGRLLLADERKTFSDAAGDHALVELGERFERPIFLPGEGGRELRAAIALLDRRVQRMIDERRAAPGRTDDLLSHLLAARDEDDGGAMSDKQVRDEILTLFIAGHETTSTALAWTVHCLARHPAVYDAVEREVDALEGEPTFADLPRLGLTLRAFKEALRLYPPVYLIGRQANEASSLDGVSLPYDTIAILSAYALHRRPDLWPDPERFDPDRFLPEREAKRHRLAWLPFGAGPRVCIGNQFAMMEGQLVLAKLLRHARFTPTLDEVPLASATLRPAHGMPVRVRLRAARRTERANEAAIV
jgi:cytochrome P450